MESSSKGAITMNMIHLQGRTVFLKEGLYHDTLDTFLPPVLAQVLKATNWNQCKAADLLGINRNTLRKYIRKYGLKQS